MGFKLLLLDFDGTLFDLDLTHESGTEYDKEINYVKDKFFDPEVVDLLNDLLENYTIKIITRNYTDTVLHLLHKSEIDIDVWGNEAKMHIKPHPQPAYFAMAQAGVTADETLVIGDSVHDLNLAKAIGSECAIVANEKLEYQPEGANYYLESLSDIYEIL